MAQLLEFPQENKTINIIVEIGDRYRELGILLLNDDSGAKTNAIIAKFREDPFHINLEVLMQWIRGSGITPVTWETFVAKLKSVRLAELAKEIEKSLH